MFISIKKSRMTVVKCASVSLMLILISSMMTIPSLPQVQATGSTIMVGNGPYGVGVNSVTDKIYVTNQNDNTVSVIDGNTNVVMSTISVGQTPAAAGVNTNTNTIYVPNYNSGTISVINGNTNAVTQTIIVGSHPHGVAINSNTNMIYVANSGTNTVSVINGNTNSVVQTIVVGNGPFDIDVDPMTNMIYTANGPDSTVSVINGNTNSVVHTITVGADPFAIKVNNNTDMIYIANGATNTVSVINGNTNSVVQTITVGNHPNGVGVDGVTNVIYVTNNFDNTVSVINGNTNSVVQTITVGSSPIGVGVNGATNMVYIANDLTTTVSVIVGVSPTPTESVNLSPVCINGLQVDINGGASHGSSVTSIAWNWGDGTTTTGFFPNSHIYSTSNTYTVTVTANYNDGTSASSSQNVNVAPGNLSNCYSLTINAGSGGSISYVSSVGSNTVPIGGSKQLYLAAGDDLTLTANPSKDYSFSSWTTSGTITGFGGQPVSQIPNTSVVVGSNAQIGANFQLSSGTLSVSTLTGGSITVQSSAINGGTAAIVSGGASQSWTVPLGSLVQLTATPPSGDTFGGWTLTGGISIANSSPCSSTSCESVTITVASNGFASTNYHLPLPYQSWAGYSVVPSDGSSNHITSVAGSWTVSSVQVPLVQTLQESSQWVGIGGISSTDPLIQVGTASDVVPNSLTNLPPSLPLYYAWYEVITSQCAGNVLETFSHCPSAPLGMLILPGDKISASVSLSDPTSNLWTITIDDLTQNEQKSIQVNNFASQEDSADWIVENQCTTGPLCSLANFGTTFFGNDYTSVTATNYATLGSNTEPMGALSNTQYVMETSGGTTLAQPSPLSTDGTSFSVQYNASPPISAEQATSTTTIQGSAASIDQSSTTGISVTISDPSAPDGTNVSMTSSIIGTSSPPGTSQINLGLGGFYDVHVSGISSGTANVCLTNHGISSQSIMLYWNPVTQLWVPARDILNTPGPVPLVTSGTICGDIPVSALTGTPIVIGSTLLAEKIKVITNLKSLNPVTHDDKQDISKAIKQLIQSIDSSFWNADGIHLDAKKGDQIFEHEKQAVKYLTDIVKDDKETATGFNSIVENDIAILVSVDKTIANTAIADANSTASGLSGNHAKDEQNDIAQAQKEMSQASDETSKGHVEDAIDHYKNAWKHAEDAISDAQQHH